MLCLCHVYVMAIKYFELSISVLSVVKSFVALGLKIQHSLLRLGNLMVSNLKKYNVIAITYFEQPTNNK